MKYRITESRLRSIIREAVEDAMSDFDEPYDYEGLDDERKDFENFLSWRNKDEVDANDRVMTMDVADFDDDDQRRFDSVMNDMADTRPNARRHWDWGYRSGLR